MAWHGHANGRVPADLMTVFVDGKRLQTDFAHQLGRMFDDCERATGVRPFIAAGQDLYRDYDTQVEYFLDRFVTYNTGRLSRVWGGVRYWLKLGKSDAAVPGTSNHGDAIAADFSNWTITRVWNWVVANCSRYNIRVLTVKSEKWHLYYYGPTTTKASNPAGDVGTPIEEDDMYTDQDRARDAATNAAIGRIEVHAVNLRKELKALTGNEAIGRAAIGRIENHAVQLRNELKTLADQ